MSNSVSDERATSSPDRQRPADEGQPPAADRPRAAAQRITPAAAKRRAKNMRRAEAKRAARKAAATRQRLRFLGWVGSGLLTLAIVLGVAVACGAFDRDPAATDPSATPSANPALATKPVVSAGTGTLDKLNVTTLVEGTGPALANGQQVSVNYVGVKYASGEEFDSSWKEGGQPFSFSLGSGGVIQGWDQGLVGVKVGSRVQLDIPAALAYPNPQPGQPEGPLRFVVDVISAS